MYSLSSIVSQCCTMKFYNDPSYFKVKNRLPYYHATAVLFVHAGNLYDTGSYGSIHSVVFRRKTSSF